MKLISVPNPQKMGEAAAQIIAQTIQQKPNSTLGLATGSTPLPLYATLVELYQQGLDFSQVITFNLDEYCGLGPDHNQSYRYFMQQQLFEHINVQPENIHIPNGLAQDTIAESKRYEEQIQQVGGIDLQILGIGTNGHIGFNEPSDAIPKYTHKVNLAEETIRANARFFDDINDVPRTAISMGIKSIMQARNIVLLCSGEAKAQILHESLTGPITPQVPASLLQLHPQLTVIATQDALTLFDN